MYLESVLAPLGAARCYDLSQPYFVGMPHHPNHPPFLFSLAKQHGDYVTPGGTSSASEAITLGGHVGTHIDSLCHFSCNGVLHGGIPAAGNQSYGEGLKAHSIAEVGLIVRRGVLLDIAELEGVDELPEDFSVTAEHLERAQEAHGVTVRAGDVVLLRTGWARFWREPARYIRQTHGPGPEEPGAQWLSARRIFAAGSDTIAFEKVPATNMPVHVHMLVESGIYLLEALNLEELARDKQYEFLFVGTPLKIEGGTGSPIRPFALV
ncbi:MAG: cyclase family protein [Bryobacterales bacterium]|nr:cyclase family protein [Bryobacterales bacterium]